MTAIAEKYHEKMPVYKETGWDDTMHMWESAEKDDSWARAYMMMMVMRCAQATDYAILISRMMEEVAYREGRQSTERYRQLFGRVGPAGKENHGQGSNNTDTSILNLNYDPLPAMTKVVDILVELGVKRGYYVGVRAGDASSHQRKAREKYEMKAKVLIQQSGLPQQINQTMGVQAVQMPPGLPSSVEEVDEIMNDFRLAEEAAMETLLTEVLRGSDWSVHYRKLVDDLITNNIGITDERSDGKGCIIARRIDPLSAIYDMDSLSYCERHFGEVMEFSDSGLISFACDHGFEASKEVWKVIISQSKGYSFPFIRTGAQPVPMRVEQYRTFFNLNAKGLTRVARCTWKSTCTDAWRAYKMPKNEQSRVEKLPRHDAEVKGKDKKAKASYEEIWEGYIILGSNVVFGVQRVKDQGRTKGDYSTISQTPFPVTVIRPALEKSIARRMMSIADQIQLAWLKWQVLLQEVKPPGTWFDLPAIVEGLTNKDSPKTGVFDAIDIYRSKGYMFGVGQNGIPPIQAIPNSVAHELTALWQNMAILIQQMKELAGLNEYTDATTPNAKALIGLGEMAQAGTNNAVGRIYEAGRELVRKMTQKSVTRLETIARNFGLSRYEGAIGTQAMLLLQDCAEVGFHALGVEISSNPDETRMNILYEELRTQRATYSNSGGKDGIGVDDLFSILAALENGEGLRRAEMLLRSAVQRIKREAAEQSQMEHERLMESQIASGQAAQEDERKTLELKSQLDMAVDTNYLSLQGQNSLNVESVRMQGLMQKEAEATGRHMMTEETDRMWINSDKQAEQDKLRLEYRKLMEDIRMRIRELEVKRIAATKPVAKTSSK